MINLKYLKLIELLFVLTQMLIAQRIKDIKYI